MAVLNFGLFCSKKIAVRSHFGRTAIILYIICGGIATLTASYFSLKLGWQLQHINWTLSQTAIFTAIAATAAVAFSINRKIQLKAVKSVFYSGDFQPVINTPFQKSYEPEQIEAQLFARFPLRSKIHYAIDFALVIYTWFMMDVAAGTTIILYFYSLWVIAISTCFFIDDYLIPSFLRTVYVSPKGVSVIQVGKKQIYGWKDATIIHIENSDQHNLLLIKDGQIKIIKIQPSKVEAIYQNWHAGDMLPGAPTEPSSVPSGLEDVDPNPKGHRNAPSGHPAPGIPEEIVLPLLQIYDCINAGVL